MSKLVKVDGLTFGYGGTPLLRDLSLRIGAGEIVVVQARSGSGKTTLLHCLAGIHSAPDAELWVAGKSLRSLSEGQRARLRLNDVGLVFQSGELLPELSTQDNVALPARLAGVPARHAKALAVQLLDELGLGSKARSSPRSLSGGERQRVAVARALINGPQVILADEPTGSLDARTARQVIELLVAAARSRSAAVLIVTHDEQVAAQADRRLRLHEGALVQREVETAA